MKAKELRIGNYFEHMDDIKIVSGIEQIPESILWDSNGGENIIELCEPIPLTEEWLLKFGFVKDKIGDEYYKGDFIIYLPYFFQWKDSVLNKIKYAHQLQNLYFALTGKELIYEN